MRRVHRHENSRENVYHKSHGSVTLSCPSLTFFILMIYCKTWSRNRRKMAPTCSRDPDRKSKYCLGYDETSNS